ncbi:hypothetical protein XMM379_003133 [Aliiroseovarius sp. xm-m-379]|nr:hypothetical protein [Aliiroseovarius sp. xm-m-379]
MTDALILTGIFCAYALPWLILTAIIERNIP